MSQQAPSRPQLLRVLLVVLAAAGLNSLGITIAGNAMIFAGSFAYMPLVFLLPWRWAVPAVTVAVLPTYFSSGYPYALIVSILEVMWLATIFRFTRQRAMLLAFTFWVVIGIPFSTWLMRDISGFPTEIVLLLTTKQLLTQLLAVGFAQFVVGYTPFASYLRRERSRGTRLRDLVFNYVFVMAAVPLVMVAVGFSQIVKVAADRADERELGEAAVRVARELDLFLQVHRESTEVAAHLIEAGAGGNPGDVLVEIRHAHPAFLTMLVADKAGLIQQAAPAELMERARGTSVADRDYFRLARDTGRPQVSGAFRGRGFGRDLLVALSAPLRNEQGEFQGIVQGAVELQRIGRLAAEAGQLADLQFIIADINGRAIYSSPDLVIPPLAHLRHYPFAGFLGDDLPEGALVLNHPNQKGVLRAWKAVGARSEVTGTLVIAVRPQLAGLSDRMDFYVLLIVIVAGVFATASVVGRVAAKRLSVPLEHFAKSTEVQAATGEVDAITPPSGASPPQEIELVYTAFNYLALSLRESYDELRRNNAVLDQRVADRTAELKAANDSKSAFLAMTSHEIRTPLNAILGLTDALLAQPLPSAAAERLQTIRSSGVLLMEVVNDLLDLSQAEAGRLVLRPSRVEIGELCRDICRLFSARAERQGISLHLEFVADGPVWVETDGPRLRQVLINLVGNGLKFTHKGSVLLRCEATEQNGRSRLYFTVADTGPGIPADKQARLFEPYYRGDNAAVQNVVGTGLGLPISQSLVALLGGNLEVNSVLGRGTQFFFNLDLPALAAPEVPTPVAGAQGSAPSFPQLRILAVDDNIANQEVIRALLEDRCARLEVVGTGREAIALLKNETFDVALVDLEMPGIDGIEVVRQVKAAGAAAASVQCRMFAVSAHPKEQLRERCRGHGFDGYVEKPLNRKELMEAIASAC